MKKKSIWTLKLNTATLALIPMAVAINYIGKMIAATLKLPLWLDSIGTIFTAFVAGPIAGAIVGGLTNVISGLTDPISLVYALTNIAIGLVAGVLAAKATKKTFAWALSTGIVIALVAIVVSTPLNIMVWDGFTGNAIGDAALGWALASGWPLWLGSLLDEVIVDLPDKIVVTLIVYGLYKAVPENLLLTFGNQDEIESLD